MPRKAGRISNVVCPSCGHSLDDVIESLIRQRGRFKGQREQARKELAEARAQADALAEALLYYVRGEHLRDYTNGRDTTAVARDAVTVYRSSQESSDAT